MLKKALHALSSTSTRLGDLRHKAKINWHRPRGSWKESYGMFICKQKILQNPRTPH